MTLFFLWRLYNTDKANQHIFFSLEVYRPNPYDAGMKWKSDAKLQTKLMCRTRKRSWSSPFSEILYLKKWGNPLFCVASTKLLGTTRPNWPNLIKPCILYLEVASSIDVEITWPCGYEILSLVQRNPPRDCRMEASMTKMGSKHRPGRNFRK